MANRPDALQSSRRSQYFSASIRTTWLYRPDAIQCLTSIRVYASRHIYGKTASTVRTMFSIRQVVHPTFNRPNISLHGRDARVLYMEIPCIISNHPDDSLHGPDAPKPCYENCVQMKCNRPDARATPPGRPPVF
jgi:hypothetical protein